MRQYRAKKKQQNSDQNENKLPERTRKANKKSKDTSTIALKKKLASVKTKLWRMRINLNKNNDVSTNNTSMIQSTCDEQLDNDNTRATTLILPKTDPHQLSYQQVNKVKFCHHFPQGGKSIGL